MEMILYLVAKGGDPKAVNREGKTTADMANGPVQRIQPWPEALALLEKSGAVNNHRWQAADGTGSAERVTGTALAFPGSVTPDGQAVLWSSGGFAVMRTSLTGERRTDRVLGPVSSVLTAEVSPDGRWLAYQSNESGMPEVYVRPYPDVDAGRWQISTERGSRPAWSRNRRELFFLDGTDRLSVVSIAVKRERAGSRRFTSTARCGVLPGILGSRRLPPRLRRVSRRAAVPHDQGQGGRGRVRRRCSRSLPTGPSADAPTVIGVGSPAP
jgi:hypothetical protein